MALEDTPENLYEAHKKYAGTGKGLMIGDEWRYTGRIGVARGLIAGIQPSSVLDVGCGYGCISECLPLDTGYLGIDYTQWIVEEARRRYPNRAFLHGRFEDLEAKPTHHMVVALGVLATVQPADVPAFVERLRSCSHGYVMVSYLDAGVYSGRLYAHALDDLNRAFGFEPEFGPVWSPDDALNKTVVYEV